MTDIKGGAPIPKTSLIQDPRTALEAQMVLRDPDWLNRNVQLPCMIGFLVVCKLDTSTSAVA